ncbi:phenylacetate-CoA oxygenase subunit PaaI [Natrarchaeobius halalkaliphilus]|uniref:Phenylacetate-CoA oxygenase subunit PaaI n=2 Tax=Natrarchaeobius halalkaliphilus TaxID=1679091 RepID=A0A3N6P0F7_9EURY|nr:phenylacetate-CoA oxygenase subunit PaaI [Natrarchaeobius halalkaliphilus]
MQPRVYDDMGVVERQLEELKSECKADDDVVVSRVSRGETIETIEEMSPNYLETLVEFMLTQHDTEIMSACAYHPAATQKAPTLDAKISGSAVVQDEVGHANLGYRVLSDLGFDKEALMYERDPKEWRNMRVFDEPFENFAEFACGVGFYDRAGTIQIGDIEENCSFGPWRRYERKVVAEEGFHKRLGDMWFKRLGSGTPEQQQALQDAVDKMFPKAIAFLGHPENEGKAIQQIREYSLRKGTNHEHRQEWLRQVYETFDSLEVDIPIGYDESEDEYDVTFDMDWKGVYSEWKESPGPVDHIQTVQGVA